MNKTYKLRAFLLCHDVRLTDYVFTSIEADKAPTEQEAARLLDPAVQVILRRSQGEGCQYELSNITIREFPNQA